jgi:hypothetical protein
VYSSDNLDWLQSWAIHFKIASGFRPSRLQIDYRWKTRFIHAGNKDHISRHTFGWEIRTLYFCEFYECLRSWIVRFLFSHLKTFIPYFKSISIEKIAIFRLAINTIQIRTHLVKYYQYFTRVTYSKVWRNLPLFWMFASDNVTYVIQIDFKWQSCYIPPGNKDRINMNSIE